MKPNKRQKPACLLVLPSKKRNKSCCGGMLLTDSLLSLAVGRHHRDGRAEQTHSHLPGLPRHGAQPEQLAALWMDPAAGGAEGAELIGTLPQPRNTHTDTHVVLKFGLVVHNFESVGEKEKICIKMQNSQVLSYELLIIFEQSETSKILEERGDTSPSWPARNEIRSHLFSNLFWCSGHLASLSVIPPK